MKKHFWRVRVRAVALLACGLAMTTLFAATPGATTGTRSPITEPGDHHFTLRHDGHERAYRVHVPRSYRPGTPAPLLLALHGGGGNMDFQADDARYGLITLSEREGVVLVFPNGHSKLRSGQFATWNAGRCCGPARDEAVDDVGFLRAVVAGVAGQLGIERPRVYATGMSNGAMMAYRLACEAPDMVRAIAAVAGTDNTTRCTPGRPVPVLHIHAQDDSHVLFHGGAGPGARNKQAVTDYTSVPATVARWSGLNGCTAAPRRTLDTPGAWCEVSAPCQGGSEVMLCVTSTGGHSWPGAGKTRGDPASQAISANAVMWDFFRRH